MTIGLTSSAESGRADLVLDSSEPCWHCNAGRFDFFSPTNCVIETFSVALFVLVEGVEQVVHPFFEFFLLVFRQFVESKLEFVTDIGSMDRLVTDDQFDDFSNVGQFVSYPDSRGSKETRVEEEGFKKTLAIFFSRGLPLVR